MRTKKSIQHLIIGIIANELNAEVSTEKYIKIADRIIEALTEEENLNIPPVMPSVCDCGMELPKKSFFMPDRCANCGTPL